MVSPYFEGAEPISGLGLPQFIGFGPSSEAKTGVPDPNLGQKLTLNRLSTDPQLTPNQPQLFPVDNHPTPPSGNSAPHG